MSTPFKLKGWSGYQNSPVKDTEEEAGKKHQHPHTEKEQEAIELNKGVLEDRIGSSAANAKLIAEFKAKYKTGKITKGELNDAIKEIKGYIDF